MPNPLYNSLMNTRPSIMSEFNSFRQNPMYYLFQKRINIPQEYLSNPRDAVQYLMNNGRMTQEQFNRLSQMAQQMGMRL